MKKWIIPLIITVITFGAFVLIGYAKLKYDPEYQYIYLNALSSSSLVVILFALLVWVSQEGAFDIMVYGTKKFLRSFTRKMFEDMPKTFADYVEEKHGKPKLVLYPTFIIAIIPLVLYIVLRLLNVIC